MHEGELLASYPGRSNNKKKKQKKKQNGELPVSLCALVTACIESVMGTGSIHVVDPLKLYTKQL